MRLIMKDGGVEVWQVTDHGEVSYYVYGVLLSGDPRICPSLDMAMAIAAQGGVA